MQVIQPKIVCVCCCAGSSEYKAAPENVFPSQKFIDNIAPYTDAVFVTTISTDNENKSYASMNGNITVLISKDKITVECSASDKKLKDTEWFKNNRTKPNAWQ